MTVHTLIKPTPALIASYEDHMGDDLAVVNAAKVSFGNRSEWEKPGPEFLGMTLDKIPNKLSVGDARLVNYLARGMTKGDYDNMLAEILMADDKDEIAAIVNHWRNTPLHKSPFNHSFLKFHVKAPIFVARQLVKHEYMPWNEISGRYVEFGPNLYFPDGLRLKAENKKQGSGDLMTGDRAEKAMNVLVESSQSSYNSYVKLLRLGVCEEQARMVLPLNLVTEWIWSGSLGAFATMCMLRLGHDAQPESQTIARSIAEQIEPLFPVAWKALMSNGTA